jgi:SAM-dependent methyltransferase
LNIKLKNLTLINKSNIEKSYAYAKANGFKAFLNRAREKLSEEATFSDSLPSPNADPSPSANDESASQSIWDNSLEQYRMDDFKLYWELVREIQKYQFREMTGNEEMDFLTFSLNYCRENFPEGGLRALWIGCMDSDPSPEVVQFGSGMFSRMEVMDIAEGLLRKQQQLTLDRGIKAIEYVKQDFNEVALEENAYDVIFSVGTIHHTENLELLFDQINKALKADGKLILRDYVGPNRLQFTDLQLGIINQILSLLPEKYKRKSDGSVKDIVFSCDLDHLMKVDPSEAVRSQDIVEVMKERLDIIKLAYTGGTLLHPMLSEIASNFEQDQDAETVLKLLIFFEKFMIDKNILPSDYAFCIAQKKLSTHEA